MKRSGIRISLRSYSSKSRLVEGAIGEVRNRGGSHPNTDGVPVAPGDSGDVSRLASTPNADMMSDMKTFTVRELDRAPAVVLDACDRDGEARIRRRDGRIYRLMPAAGPKRAMTRLPDFAARRAKVFKKALTAAQARQADEAIRGE